MPRSAALELAPVGDGATDVGPFEVRALSPSLFSTLVGALIESLLPSAALRYAVAEATTSLRPTDVLLTHEPTGRSLIVFGATPDRHLVSRYLADGTQSMISVEASKDELIAAVQSLISGPPFVSTGVVQALANIPEGARQSPLTAREQEIVAFVVEGLTNREMAERLCLSTNTIRTHLQSASGKLGVNSRTKLAARARALGIA